MEELDEATMAKLVSYVDGELGPQEMADVEDLLLRSDKAMRFVDVMRTVDQLLRQAMLP